MAESYGSYVYFLKEITTCFSKSLYHLLQCVRLPIPLPPHQYLVFYIGAILTGVWPSPVVVWICISLLNNNLFMYLFGIHISLMKHLYTFTSLLIFFSLHFESSLYYLDTSLSLYIWFANHFLLVSSLSFHSPGVSQSGDILNLMKFNLPIFFFCRSYFGAICKKNLCLTQGPTNFLLDFVL